MSARFELYPAIDVRAGRVVRLRQGDYSRETRYGEDPCGLAVAYAAAGAKWLHLVDLDAARSGGYTLGSLVSGIKAATALRVQTGGGVRSEADVQAILDAGADRVVIGSLAVHEPDAVCRWIERYGPERIVVALDTRADVQGQWRLPTHGWTDGGNESSPRFEALLQRYASAGLRHMLCTDIARDGMLSGPNCDLYRLLQALGPSLAVQASGGIRDVADIQAARDAGCAGAVLGRALLEGRLDLAEALTC